VPNAEHYRIEWAPSVDGPWTNFAAASLSLDLIAATGSGTVTSTVPMLYRVVATATVTNPPAPTAVFEVSNSGASSYLINGEANLTLHLVRGSTYVIEVNSPGHPFWIKSTPSTGTSNQYNEGVNVNGIEVGKIVFTVPMDAPDTLYYICQFHSSMQGLIDITDPDAPVGMVLIPSGTNSGTNPDFFEAYSLTVDSFYMDQYPVTKALWDAVYAWATHADRGANVYTFSNSGSGKATNHPVHTVSWYDVVKWCTARSEMEGRPPVYTINGSVYRTGQEDDVVQTAMAGYRLPTEAEWEYAARGGLQSQRFPWGDEITHAHANYWSSSQYSYDTSATREYHPTYETGGFPYTSPAGSFAANGYGLYDMAGNVFEWVFDWHPTFVGSHRVVLGGSWFGDAFYCRVASGYPDWPTHANSTLGFRAVLPLGQ
jgi:formylglycine-generating enzyme required for sulfatase activity